MGHMVPCPLSCTRVQSVSCQDIELFANKVHLKSESLVLPAISCNL